MVVKAQKNGVWSRMKDDIRFVIFLFGCISAVLVWGVRFESRVQALDVEVHEKGTVMRQDIDEISKQLDRIEDNQILLLHDAGLEPVRE